MSTPRTILLISTLVLSQLFSMTMYGAEKPSRAKNYYVDAERGNDKHNGRSPQRAWKTVQRANLAKFNPGDSLLFKSGHLFKGQLKPVLASTAGSPFVIASYGNGAKPTIDGGGLLPAAVWLYNLQNVEVTHLRIVNQAPQRVAGLAGIKVQIDDYGVAKHVVLRQLDVEDVNGSLEKKMGGGSGILIQNGGRKVASLFDGLLIDGCTIRRCERNGIIFGSYWSRQDWHPNLNVAIRHNVIEEVPGDGIVPIGCDGAVIEHNVMRNCTRLLPLGEAAAGIWPWSCDNTLVQFNEVSDHKAPWDGQGFDSDWNCKNTLIQYNYSHDNEGGFMLVCDDGGVSSTYSVGNKGTVIRYNISINDGTRKAKTHAGVFSPVVHFAGPASGTKFYNNLIVHVGEVADSLDNSFIHFSGWGGLPGTTLFANNLFVSATPTTLHLDKCQGIEFANNLFSGAFGQFPPTGNNLNLTLKQPQWSLFDGAPKGFDGLAKFKVCDTFEGLSKGIVMDANGATDFFGNPINPSSVNIGIDQTSFQHITTNQ